ncbi:MAG: hypothetical protein GC201_09450 [Alphaproteobacteria bacterium]|nr:hypothetical protein [Alphaproteobacteria bacterium]
MQQPVKSRTESLRDMYARRAQGDLQPLFDFLADDVDWRSMGEAGAVPWAGRWQGAKGVVHYFKTVGGTVEVLTYDPLDCMEEGDQVAFFCRLTYRAKGTQHVQTVDKVDLFTFRDGKVARFWEIYHVGPVTAHLLSMQGA